MRKLDYIALLAKSRARLVTILGRPPTIVFFAHAHPFAIPTLLRRCITFQKFHEAPVSASLQQLVCNFTAKGVYY